MLEFLNNFNWVTSIIDLIVSLIVAIIILAFQVIISESLINKRRNFKKLEYEILTFEPIFTPNSAHQQNVKIFDNQEEIKNPSLIEIKLINSGQIKITADEMEMPPAFSFGEKTKILDFEIINKHPKYLQPYLRPSNTGRGIVLNKLLLNEDDFVEIKFLVDNYNGEICPSSRIEDINHIMEITPPISKKIFNIRSKLVNYRTMMLVTIAFAIIIYIGILQSMKDPQIINVSVLSLLILFNIGLFWILLISPQLRKILAFFTPVKRT